ncbi:MAG: helix-turn-helix transcriptional regulator [Bacteroides sp.]|nr:helix-turn-helix transcriptional regulator [Bacteroides sp.]
MKILFLLATLPACLSLSEVLPQLYPAGVEEDVPHIHLDTLFIYLMLLAFITFITVRLLIRRKRQKVAEEKVDFFINTAGALHTPLVDISKHLKEIAQRENLTKSGRQHIAQAQDAIHLLIRLSNELVNFEWIALHADNEEEQAFITNVREQIELHITEPTFNVDTLCTLLNMSRTSFYNKIKELTDKAPGDYIRLVRLKRAAQLLKEQQHTITEVAEMTGFNDVKYFREVFKKHFGVTPREYAK